jgi:hypothetical protein
MKNIPFILLIVVLTIFSIQAQEPNNQYYSNDYNGFEDMVYKSNIQTVLIYRSGWELSYPVIKLNDDSKICLAFDDITTNIRNYWYTIIHCDAEWRASNLNQSDYIQGFPETQINDYQFSFNTTCSYIHYKVEIPNQNMKPLLSGNYIIKVYEDSNQENVVLTSRFSIVDEKVKIDALVHRATWVNEKKEGQEVDFTVQHKNYTINDAEREIKVFVLQNNRKDRAIAGLKPKSVSFGMISYDYDKENVFDGGNEFRYFDAKNVKFRAIRTKDIYFIPPYYHFELREDGLTNQKYYTFHEDLNGKRLIKLENDDKSEIDADYVFVHFTLYYPTPLIDGAVYVNGTFSDWRCTDKNRMSYNIEKKSYELILFLKQGYYNYVYTFLKEGSKQGEESFLEGNYYQTENDYVIYIYHHEFSSRYDKLIGWTVVNSIKRL